MSRAISCGSCTSKYLPLIFQTCKTAMQKPPSKQVLGRLSLIRVSLCHSQRFQRRLIDRCCLVKSVIALEIGNGTARERPNETVHVAMIITLLLEGGLYICDYLVRRQVIVSVDRTVPGIVCVGIVAPGREPITSVPVIRGTEHKDNIVMVM